MKLHFDDCFQSEDLSYQARAVESVCELFGGAETFVDEFSVFGNSTQKKFDFLSENIFGNGLNLSDEALFENLKKVQAKNNLPISQKLQSKDFVVEMETGTGKTYVYLRTIFELNKRFGLSKFAIVVPSIAVKEGVKKSLEIMSQHFRALYAGVPFGYFVYDSAKMGEVRNFANSSQIEIMILTVGAINKKDVNNLYKQNEKTDDNKPIDLIQSVRPIVIVDEPQSVDGGLLGAGKAALQAMNALCTLRYSATHVDKSQMIYRLNAVEAYEKKLVKQIEVAGLEIINAHNLPYVRLVSINNNKGNISAKIEVDIALENQISRKEILVYDGDDLQKRTKREIYANYKIGNICAIKNDEFLELLIFAGGKKLKIGEAHEAPDLLALQRAMIRKTILEHAQKERHLNLIGVKVLSLFFVPKVESYRKIDAQNSQQKGELAQIFEEEYCQIFGVEKSQAAKVHEGYFSIDKKGAWQNSDENNQQARDNSERAYNLIMRDKEKLLSFDSDLKFIFSHSALREGWDNPNIFQICNLREMHGERQRRQTIGRGLRLCVNQDGQRLRGFDVNILTVIASETYEDFAQKLQKEIEDETGVKFAKSNIKNSNQRHKIELNSKILASKEFNELWNRIKRKTTYRVDFDNRSLIKNLVEKLENFEIAQSKILFSKAKIEMNQVAISAKKSQANSSSLEDISFAKTYFPNLLNELEKRTKLTRKTLVEILKQSGRLSHFKRNCQGFIEEVAKIINEEKQQFLVDGVSYKTLQEQGFEDFFYKQELFESQEIFGYFDEAKVETKVETKIFEKSLFKQIIFDSEPENKFAAELENQESVKVFSKLPAWFKIATPLGNYCPDWALVVNKNNQEEFYFVVETKSNLQNLRSSEDQKIKCGEAHFSKIGEAFENPAKFKKETSAISFLSKI